ncbi:MAG: DUF3288 family protein [Cyanobacteriota bacterium]|nr:DUF3288 family protein [Cyanobacteriota bacterium]
MLQPQDRRHPQENRDRAIVDRLIAEGKSDYNLAELARLRIRYQGFPGARAIQSDLNNLLVQWGLSEEELFAKTRQLHDNGLYRRDRQGNAEDWS